MPWQLASLQIALIRIWQTLCLGLPCEILSNHSDPPDATDLTPT